MKTIELVNSVLDSLDMHSHLDGIGCYKEYFTLESGKEHYRLLRYLASKIDTHIIEIGTHCASSAFAMSIDTKHDIITYDIVDIKENDFSSINNIKFNIKEFMDDLENREIILSSKMIFIDAPHDGMYEKKCYDWLQKNNFTGIAVWDDIHLNPAMENFWQSISHTKIDVTRYGHVTGTGVVNFSNNLEIVLK